jgi:hypothetical protein
MSRVTIPAIPQIGSAIYADWWDISAKQQEDLYALRERIADLLIAETEAFYQEHPELKVDWQFTVHATIRKGSMHASLDVPRGDE